MDFNHEQQDMLKTLEDFRKKYPNRRRGQWNKFLGSITSKIISAHLQKHLPKNVKIIKLGYVEGFEREIDLLIVDRNAEPAKFTDAFPQERVRVLVEVKTSGLYYKKKEVGQKLSKELKYIHTKTRIPVSYISFYEVRSFIEEIQRSISNNSISAFILHDWDNLRLGEWKLFVNWVLQHA